MTVAVVVIAVVLAAIGVLRKIFLIINVYGDSMGPAFAPGDRLLVRRRRLAAVRLGDVVVIAAPDARPEMDPRDRWHVKRVAALPGDPMPQDIPVTDAVVPPRRLVVLGDNRGRSVDSRTTGLYEADALIGIVVRRANRLPPAS
jgi:signal peptidase I